MDTVVVIMLKDLETGFLEKELGSLIVLKNENLLVNVFGVEVDSKMEIHMKVTIDRDAEDWEFQAIYDYYDETIYADALKSIKEVEDCYNPTWEMIFDFPEDMIDVEDKVGELLAMHLKELQDVYEVIKDKKGEYIE